MTTQPVIRHAVFADLHGLLDLYRYLHPDDPTPEPGRAETVWSALLASEITTPIVAELEGRIVASCTLAVITNLTRGARPFGVIENVITHPQCRRIGLGRAVLHAPVQLALQANCHKVSVATGSKQEATLQFYERSGFRRSGKTDFEIRLPQATK